MAKTLMHTRGRVAARALITALSAVIVCSAALAASSAATALRPPSPQLAARSPSSVTVRWRPQARPARYQLRSRLRSQRRWHLIAGLGRRTSFTQRHLATGATLLFELRSCVARRCSRWSRPLRAGPGPAAARPPTGAPPSTAGSPMLGGCPVFPADNAWNRDISGDAVDPNSANYISSLSGDLHPDFGSDPSYGIPYVIVPDSQRRVPIDFTAYGSESDPGPYPVPTSAPVEAGSDHHVLVLQQGSCRLYELFNASFSGASDGHWSADAGAAFDLRSNALRHDGWTSADAAGLPILPGLVRFDEVRSGAIHHALRVTFDHTQKGYIHPATHLASSSTNPNLPPMGLRLRLKASFDISSFPPDARVILQAMKTYGLIVADNGSNWYFTGATDSRWNDDQLNTMKSVPGSAFEAVASGPILHNTG